VLSYIKLEGIHRTITMKLALKFDLNLSLL